MKGPREIRMFYFTKRGICLIKISLVNGKALTKYRCFAWRQVLTFGIFKKALLSVIVPGFLLASPAYAASYTGPDVAALTNAKRAEAGLASLAADAGLSAIAEARARDMLERNYFAHYGPDGSSVITEANARGYAYTILAENLARGCSTATCVVNGWAGSPGHREVLLHQGIIATGVAVADGTIGGVRTVLVVGVYAHPAAAKIKAAPLEPAPATPAESAVPQKAEDPVAAESRAPEQEARQEYRGWKSNALWFAGGAVAGIGAIAWLLARIGLKARRLHGREWDSLFKAGPEYDKINKKIRKGDGDGK